MSLGTKKIKNKTVPANKYGPTNSVKNIEWWKLGDDAKRVWKIEWWVMSYEWWVMSDEWWKLSDEKTLAKQALRFQCRIESEHFCMSTSINLESSILLASSTSISLSLSSFLLPSLPILQLLLAKALGQKLEQVFLVTSS